MSDSLTADEFVVFSGRRYRPNSTCYMCDKPFYVPPSRKKDDSCCSIKCMGVKKRGRPQSEVFGKNCYSIPKGHTPWNKGIKGYALQANIKPCAEKRCGCCGFAFFVKPSQSVRKFCSAPCSLRMMQIKKKGTRVPSIAGPNHYRWKEDRTELRKAWHERNKPAYREFVAEVLSRDGYQCVLCGSTKRLEVDHIKRFSEYPELRTDINNGRTLCHECHVKTPNYGNRRSKK